MTNKFKTLWVGRHKVSPGKKIADSDLIGCPIRITASGKNIELKQYEVKKRNCDEAEFVSQGKILEYLKEQLK